MCECAVCIHKCIQKRMLHAQELELQMVANHPIWMLGTEMGPVHGQQELLSDEPS